MREMEGDLGQPGQNDDEREYERVLDVREVEREQRDAVGRVSVILHGVCMWM